MPNIRTKQAAEYMGLSESTLEKYRHFGGGPAYSKLGRAVIYDTADIDAWLASRKRTETWGAANDNSQATSQAA
jgi:excisionase family DNA binding protein